MKSLLLAFTLLLSTVASATSLEEIFGPIRYAGGAACFGKTYSAAHLAARAHRSQTVKEIKVKLSLSKFEGMTSPLMEIMVKQKNAPAKMLRQAMVCFENAGRVSCAVDCDGGAVEILALEEGQLTIKNHGVILKGGCGEEEDETVFLQNTRGGDDMFVLNELPLASCKSVPFPRH